MKSKTVDEEAIEGDINFLTDFLDQKRVDRLKTLLSEYRRLKTDLSGNEWFAAKHKIHGLIDFGKHGVSRIRYTDEELKDIEFVKVIIKENEK